MELKELVGQHKLDAVDFSKETIKSWGDSFEDCNVCRFRFDGIVYVITEDPEDGYRSSMRDLVMDLNAKIKNVFPAVDVVAIHKTGNHYEDSDILEVICLQNGKIILEVGTDNYDDYYPCFVANFTPENMPINK